MTAIFWVGLFLPRFALNLLLGEKTDDWIVLLLARHWSVLGGVVAALLIYAGFHAEVRAPVMIAGATEKLVLGVLVVLSPLRRRLLTVLIVTADAIMACIYIAALPAR